MTAQGIRAVLQGMRMHGELKQPGVTPYLSPSETLVVMGCAFSCVPMKMLKTF
jgi:hypothetical protein